MIDIVALITAVGPMIVGLATAIFNFVLYLKHKALPANQNNNPASNSSESNNPK